jgi:hypothetical protein
MKPLHFLSLLTVLALPVESFAQAGPGNEGAAGRREPGVEMLTRDTLTPADLKRIAEQIDQWKRVEGDGSVTPRVAKARTAAMLRVLKTSCVVSDAAYRGTAPGNDAQHLYEAACEGGLGYLILLKDATLSGMSCLAIGSEESPLKCVLPANADSKVMAGAVLNRNGIECKVRELKMLGTLAANLDHIEVACENSGGYVMRSPHPGSAGKFDVLGCPDATRQGITCQLSAQPSSSAEPNANSRPTLAWFNDALTRNGVGCLTKRARIIGRESIKRRYLVEFECSDRPEGLVAFVPPAGDTVNSFESMNCLMAVERGIRCELVTSPNPLSPK